MIFEFEMKRKYGQPQIDGITKCEYDCFALLLLDAKNATWTAYCESRV